MPGRRQEPTAPVKGEEVSIVAGTYKGMRAWKNTARTQPEKMVYIIVEIEGGIEHATRIRKSSIGPAVKPPNSYEGAVMQQKPEIGELLRKAARLLVQCGVEDFHAVGEIVSNIFIDEQVKHHEKGVDAKYFNIEWDDSHNANDSV